MLKKLIVLLCLFLLSYTIGYAAVPVIFYSDLTSGPKTGGQNNKGVFVTVWGKNFGSSQGSSYVNIGGGQADNYPVWSDTKISFQLGSAAATGNITVTTSEGTSNGVSFAVRTCDIYFVSISGNDSNTGSFDSPWRHLSKARSVMSGGDILYIRGGTYTVSGEDSSGKLFYVSGSYPWAGNASAGSPHCIVGYPGETVILQASADSQGIASYAGSTDANAAISSHIVFANFIIDANNYEAGFNWRGCTNGAKTGVNRVNDIRLVNVEVKNYLNTGAFGGTALLQAGGDGPIDDFKVYGCKIHDMDTGDNLDHGIYFSAGGDNLDIGWNTIYNIKKVNAAGGAGYAGFGIQIYCGSSSNYADANNVLIHDNLIYECPSRGGINLADRTKTSYTYNNIVYNCGYDGNTTGHGLRVYTDTSGAAGTHYIYNNTFYNCGKVNSSGGSSIMGFWNYTIDTYVRNNIFYAVTNQSYAYKSLTSGNVTSSNNSWYGNGLPPNWANGELNANPSLVNPTGYDFNLQSNSPVINVGYNTSAIVTKDFNGITRPQSSEVDIGAYEYTGADVTAPASISDLLISNTSSSSITLAWTAPGDDNNTGTATSYDIRYALTSVNDANWTTATQVTGEPVPSIAGSTESMVITGLQSDTTYYFAMKTSDEVPNTSGISNTVSGKTSDNTAPSAVTDLTAAPGTSDGRVVVSWTAPGDDGVSGIAASYDLRLSLNTISDDNWSSATQYLSEPAPKVAGAAETITLSGLTPGSTYYFALKTSDEVPNTSALSNVSSCQAYKSGEVDITPPAGITTLSAASGAHSGEVVLNWTATGDDGSTGTALTYDIRYSQNLINAYTWGTATQCSGEPDPQVAGSAEKFVVTGLSPGQQYYFAVQAIDESNFNSGVSNVPRAVAYDPIGDTTPPEPITTLQADNTAGGEVTITWNAPGGDGASGTTLYYEIRSATYTVDASNFAQASLLDSIPVPNSAGYPEAAILYNLNIGQTYYIAVKSVDGAGNISILSNVALVVIGDDLIAPGTIADLAAVGGTNIGEIVIGWTASGNDGAIGKAKEYDIRYSTSQITDDNWSVAVKALNTPSPALSGTYQSATIGSLTPNGIYSFGIKASDTGSNVSGLSNIVIAKAKGATPPGKISDLSGTVGSSDGSVALSWTAPAAAGGDKIQKYEIRYSKEHIYEVNLLRISIEGEVEWNGAGKYPTSPSPVNPGDKQTFDLTGLDPGQKYFFAVKSYDTDSNSSVISNVAETPAATSDAIAPAKIDNLHAEPGNMDGEVILSWTAPGDNGMSGTAGSYIMKYSVGYIDTSTWDLANALTDTPTPKAAGSKEHMFVRNLLAKHRYYFAMQTVDPVGNISDISNCAETLSGPVMNLERVRSFPNPWKKASGGLITISHLTTKAKVKIFNLLGELVRELQEQNGVAFWDAKNENGQDVASGVYIYYAWDDEGHEKTGKIVIIK